MYIGVYRGLGISVMVGFQIVTSFGVPGVMWPL